MPIAAGMPQMSTIQFRRNHQLGAERAREIAEQVVADLENRYGGAHHWDGSVLHFERGGISGRMQVADDMIDLNLKLGLAMRPFRASIESVVSERMDKLLHT